MISRYEAEGELVQYDTGRLVYYSDYLQLKERLDKLHYDNASLHADLNEWKRYVQDQDRIIVRLKQELAHVRQR